MLFFFKYFLSTKINRDSHQRKTTNDNDHRYPPIILPSERTSVHMKSSTLPQYSSNPSLVVKNKKQQTYDEEPTTSTYSFRHRSNKLQHAKSHGELYQPTASLSLSPTKKTNHNESKNKHQEKYTPNSPPTVKSLRVRPTTTTTGNSPTVTQSSPSNKIPLWKRFKKMIVPTKRSKDRPNSSTKIPALLLDELSENESSKHSYFLKLIAL